MKESYKTSKATPIMYKPDHNAIKSSKTIMCMLEKVKEYELFPCHISENRGLVNPFWHQTATAAQKHDLLNFHHLGPVECLKCSQSLVSCDSIIDDIYMHLQFL